MAKAKILIRRCLLITLCGLATACSSVKQMPSYQNHETRLSEVAISPDLLLSQSIAPAVIDAEPKPVSPDQVQEASNVDSQSKSVSAMIAVLTAKFKVKPQIASEVVNLADKHAYSDFPKREDILAIIAVESGFNYNARYKGCIGLMQVEAKSHKKHLAGKSLINPDTNISLGAYILNQYYNLLGKNKRAATLAFNAGIGNYQKGRFKQVYYEKYRTQLKVLRPLPEM